jgi:hypothetical protein
MGAPRSSSKRTSTIAIGVAVVVAIGVGLTVRHLFAARSKPSASARATSASAAASRNERILHVPHMPGSITLDGDTDDPGWTSQPGPGRTRDFEFDNGAPGRPFSEVRLVWGDGFLYLSLYASDENIQTRTHEADGPLWLDDAFRVVFTQDDVEYAIEVSPEAIVTDSIRRGAGKWDYSWSSGVHASKEWDGTLNNDKDMDEEWVIEMAVPFESIGLEGKPGESIGFSVHRCDTPKTDPRICTSWGEKDRKGRLVLD